MKVKEYIYLGECALCPWSFKKVSKPLMCEWNGEKEKIIPCKKVKECGHFPNCKIDISKLELGS